MSSKKLIKLTSSDDIGIIRQSFHNFYRANGYKYMPQSKVYNDDPSLFFVTAGMCQLKDILMGKREAVHKKLMNQQICIRCSGKHNDLEDVGKDSYHLTEFEMLGSWMLDDAFNKQETIDLSFRYLTEICGLNKEQLYATYFGGNDAIPADTESRDMWLKYFPESHVISSSFKDNFWMMDFKGCCGPCSELHYDLIGNRNASDLVNKDDPNVIELWNLVFMQYNKTDSNYELLDKMHIDCGMGLERVSMVIQGKNSVYQTDAFKYLFGYAQSLTNANFYTDKYDNNLDHAYRIFVDHIRTCVVATYQGVDFDCNKRGAVLRKIYRRMMTYMYLYLNNGLVEPIMMKSQVFALIKQVLNYFLFEITDDFKPETIVAIQQKFIEEEKLHIGKLQNVRIQYNAYYKKLKNYDFTEQLKENSNLESLKHQLVVEKLRTQGIDPEFVEHIDKLRFKLE
jgi:alanyl-tRNA synthetase